jgi:hypothetical protein
MPKPLRIVTQDALALDPEDRRRLALLLIESLELAEPRESVRARRESARDEGFVEGPHSEAVAAAVVDADLASGKNPLPTSIFQTRPPTNGPAGVPNDGEVPDSDIPWTQEVERGWFATRGDDASDESTLSPTPSGPHLVSEAPLAPEEDVPDRPHADGGLGRWLVNPLRPR